MKIAYLANIRLPSERAHSVQIVHMSQAFSEMGADLDLYVNKREHIPLHDIGSFYNITPKFTLFRLGHGIMIPGWRWTYYFSELYFAAAFLLQRKASLYEKIYARNEWIVWFLSYFISPTKLVWESHQGSLSFPARSILRQRIKIVAISQGIKDLYQKRYPKNGILVADDGIDDSFFETPESKDDARKRLGVSTEKSVAVYIGGLDVWKGIDTYLKASQLASEIAFVVIGGNEAEVREYQKTYPQVQFLGARPYRELRDNQQIADVLVIPNSAKTSLSAEYTSPLKLFSYMTSGVPIVASDIPSLTSVLHSNMATLFTPDDPASLAAILKIVLGSYEKKREMASYTKAVAQRYTWKHRAGAIMTFIT